MKTNLTNENSLLFKWACKVLRYFLLVILGFAIVYILSHVFSVFSILEFLFSASVWQWIGRATVFVFCLLAIAMIYESSR